jgi:hypothetical protein
MVGPPPVAKSTVSTKGNKTKKDTLVKPIGTLTEVPDNWWTETPNERGGYQYRTCVQLFGVDVETLLDGGAGSNNITEEMVVGVINRAIKNGVKASDPAYPIVRFERWPLPEVVNGIAAKSQLALADYLSALWLTPQMDRLFTDGSSGRRRFFDKLVLTMTAQL